MNNSIWWILLLLSAGGNGGCNNQSNCNGGGCGATALPFDSSPMMGCNNQCNNNCASPLSSFGGCNDCLIMCLLLLSCGGMNQPKNNCNNCNNRCMC